MEIRELTLKQALDETKANGEVLMGVDDYISTYHDGWILHLVVKYSEDYKKVTPYLVEITRPRDLYGNEGILFTSGLRFVGFEKDQEWEELDAELTNEDWERLPENTSRMFAYKPRSIFYKDKGNPDWKLMSRGIHPALEAYKNRFKEQAY